MILNYVKEFLVLFLLMKVLLYFLPKNTFQKYIAFFTGVILVIGLFYPLLDFFGKEEQILEKLDYEHWERQLLELSENAKEVELAGKQFMEEQYMEVTEAEDRQEEGVMIETITIGETAQEGGVDE